MSDDRPSFPFQAPRPGGGPVPSFSPSPQPQAPSRPSQAPAYAPRPQPSAPPLARPQAPQDPTPSFGVPVSQTSATTSAPVSFSSLRGEVAELDKILTVAVNRGASDIHLSSGTPPRNRLDGELVPMPEYPDPVNSQWMKSIFQKIMRPPVWERYNKHLEADFSHVVEGVGRFRVNAFQQQGVPGAVFRIIPTRIKTIEELKAPQSLKEIAKKPKGLILVTGPTSSGKSTTLAAMIDFINDTRSEHIMTIEDPIEFVHNLKNRSSINVRLERTPSPSPKP